MAQGKNAADIINSKNGDSGKQKEPTISRHSATLAESTEDSNNPTKKVSTTSETLQSAGADKDVASKNAKKIEPLNQDLNSQAKDNAKEPEINKTDASEVTESKDEYHPPVDEKANKTPDATDQVQSPKIYDTTEYHLPISASKHNHGTLGIILAGIITAIVVVGGLVYYFGNKQIEKTEPVAVVVQATVPAEEKVGEESQATDDITKLAPKEEIALRDKERLADIESLKEALALSYVSNGFYPVNVAGLIAGYSGVAENVLKSPSGLVIKDGGDTLGACVIEPKSQVTDYYCYIVTADNTAELRYWSEEDNITKSVIITNN